MRKLMVIAVVSMVGGFLAGRMGQPGLVEAGCDSGPRAEDAEFCLDTNGDGTADLSDAVHILQFLFLGTPRTPAELHCEGHAHEAPHLCEALARCEADLARCEAELASTREALARCEADLARCEAELARCKAVAAPVPPTGQTICYDNTEELPSCPGPSQPFGGQDGCYQAGCPAAGRFVDNGDGTVTDTCTGLMWAKRLAQPSAPFQPAADGSGRVAWEYALDYCNVLGDPGVAADLTFDGAGHCDWRLPNVRELQSILDFGRLVPNSNSLLRNKPAVDLVFDIPDLETVTPSLPRGEAWTSTTCGWAPYLDPVAEPPGFGCAMVVGLSYGNSGWNFFRAGTGLVVTGKDHSLWVLPVRTAAASGDCTATCAD